MGRYAEMSDEKTNLRTVRGQVKWFDPVKGFGFIVSDTPGNDILLHTNVLRNFGRNSVVDGAIIEARVQDTSRGIQAVEVLSLTAPQMGESSFTDSELHEIDPAQLAEMPLEPARIKWFDRRKGFGFANVFARSEDVFVHIEVLRASGFADLQPGEAICLKVLDGERGRVAVQVFSWDTAERGRG